MSDEDSGGVRGLRTWVADASARAGRLIDRVADEAVSAEEFEGATAELTTLRDLLDHDRALRAVVTVRLGALFAMRYATGHGTPEDRERAQRLLGEVRDPATATGEAATDQDRQWAALLLLMVASPTPGGPNGAAPDFWAVFDQSLRAEPGASATAAADVLALADEAGQLPLPPEVQGQLGQMRDLLSYMTRTDLSDPETLLGMLPADLPFSDELRTLLNLLTDLPAFPDSGPTGPAPDTAAADAATGTAPQPPDPAADDTLTGARLAALLGAMEAMRTGDPEAVTRLLQRLGGELDRMPDGPGPADEVQNLMRLALQIGGPIGGSHQDGAVARDQLRAVTEHYARQSASDPAAGEFAVAARAMTLLTEARAAEETESWAELTTLVGELDALERSTPAGHTFRPLVLLALGTTLNALGSHTGDSELIVRGITCQESALTGASADSLGIPETLLTSLRDGLHTTRAVLAEAPGQLPEHTPTPPDATADALFLSGLTATLRHAATRDPADLDNAIGELERFREHARQGRSPQLAAAGLWQLAENHRMRLARTGDPADEKAATDAAMESLQALAADVVLQTGPDHGLLAARSGADRGVQAAIRAASQGRVEEAVAALELGRALVLRAASTARAVPELLEARGHRELAEAWRSAAAHQDPESDALPRQLPSSLRRRALEALGPWEPDGALFATPTVAELKAGVARGEADALVYLLAGQSELPGMAIVVGPDIGTGVRALPLLSVAESGPLERYLDAAEARQRAAGSPSAVRAWEEALEELCDWATDAVVAPVITGVAERLATDEDRRRDRPGPPRIVLVPCGRLGIVPWHAPRLPAGAPHTHVCQIMVISYAASGRQFLDAVRRSPRPPRTAPVLVADPGMSLPHADLEVTALHRACYPQARLYGELYDPPVPPQAPGTPDDLLGVLDAGPSVLHIACHGSAGTSPTASALQLAHPGGGAEPGAGPHPGNLTVARLLDRATPEPATDDGPLVVLSACETDLSNRDHDEALTLTTAFLASGARDVVGSRWATRDSSAALMMAVFHHYLSVEGLSPVDALRAAQMWMLDPGRRAPESFDADLRAELAKGPVLDRTAAWAAFIHQGHPGPAGP
ncbi:CHAT domain-containing protein [Streptomyces monashensis]|uniref:CHAT domain-containing protein n=1 Tax=Streptomyces monashensis TaxID=1678012 RepID=UPI000AE42300|nr:CHAT domain-containing protein [Streptomyces monashensis]